MASFDPFKKFELRGIGNLAGKSVDTLLKECPKEFTVAIEISNKHPNVELVYRGAYLVSGISSRQIPQRISPNQKDAIIVHASRVEDGCNGLLLFSINPVVCDSDGNVLKREPSNSEKNLLIGWKMTLQGEEQRNEYAISINRISRIGEETFKTLMNGPIQHWFKRKEATDGQSILESSDKNIPLMKVVASMDNEKKSTVKIEIRMFT